MKRIRLSFVALGLAVMPLALVSADEFASRGKTLLEVVEQLEQKGYGPFTEISFDDGHWEVEVYQDGTPYEVAVSSTGEILSKHRDDAEPRPPQDAMPLSEVLRKLKKNGYETIEEVSFERRYWEVESWQADGKHETHVDPKTGEVINDRIDD